MKKWFEIKNKAEHTDIFIYDEIGGWGIQAKDLIGAVRDAAPKTITLHLNSPGGSVFDGIAIYNFLKYSDIKVTVRVEGVAASIASIIAMCGDRVEMAENSMMMIHNPLAGFYGDSEDLRKMADLLDKVKGQLVKTYQTKTGMDADKIEAMMDSTTWLTAAEAKEQGFADAITEEIKISAKINQKVANWKEQYNFSIPKNLFPKTEGGTMDEKILKALGVSEEGGVLSAITALNERITTLTADVEAKQQESDDLLVKLDEQKVDLAISNKQIKPAQKDFALKMIKMGEDVYDEWLEQNKASVPGESIDIENGEAGDLTADDLLADAVKFEALQKSNPTLLKKILADAGIRV